MVWGPFVCWDLILGAMLFPKEPRDIQSDADKRVFWGFKYRQGLGVDLKNEAWTSGAAFYQ